MKKQLLLIPFFLIQITCCMQNHSEKLEAGWLGWIVGERVPKTLPSFLVNTMFEVPPGSMVKTPESLISWIEQRLPDHANSLLPICRVCIDRKLINIYVHHISIPTQQTIDKYQDDAVLIFQKKLQEALDTLENRCSCGVIAFEHFLYGLSDSSMKKQIRAEITLRMVKELNRATLSNIPIHTRFCDDILGQPNCQTNTLNPLIEQILSQEKKRAHRMLKLLLMVENRLKTKKLFPCIPDGPTAIIGSYYDYLDPVFLYRTASNIPTLE